MNALAPSAAAPAWGPRAVRLGLLAGAGLSTALVAAGIGRHQDMLRADPVVVVYLSMLLAGLVVAVVAAVVGTQVRAPAWQGAMWLGCRWGLLVGALWIVEMTVANLGYALGAWTVVPYFASTWAAWLLTGVAGAIAARRYRRLWAGALAGAWSGLVSGLVGLATMQILALVAMPILREDPQNLAEFRATDDLATAIAGDFLAAGINHLVLVGLIGGCVLGTVGGVAGLLGLEREPVSPVDASSSGKPPNSGMSHRR